MNLVRLLHVPKTGGTSLGKASKEALGDQSFKEKGRGTDPRLLLHLRTTGKGRWVLGDKEGARRCLEEADARFIWGHGEYSKWSWLVPAERTIVIFRDPIQRIVSQYQHRLRIASQTGRHPGPFDDFAKEHHNRHSRDVEDLDLSKACVGFTDHFEETVARVNRRFGFEFETIRHNANPYRPAGAQYDVDSDTEAFLRELNAEDYRLLAEVERVWKAQS